MGRLRCSHLYGRMLLGISGVVLGFLVGCYVIDIKGATGLCENYRGLMGNCSFYRLYEKILNV